MHSYKEKYEIGEVCEMKVRKSSIETLPIVLLRVYMSRRCVITISIEKVRISGLAGRV